MKSTSLKTVNILLILLLIAAATASVFPVIRMLKDGTDEAKQIMSGMEVKVRQLFSDSLGKQAGKQRENQAAAQRELRKVLIEYPNLKSMTVYGPDRLLLYAYARNPGLLRIDDVETIDRSAVHFTKKVLFERILSDGSSYGDDYYSEGVFELVHRDEMYRFALYIFIFLGAVTLVVFLLLVLSGSRTGSKTAAPAAKIYHQNPEKAEPQRDPGTDTVDYFEPVRSENDRIYSPDSLLCFENYLAERLDNELKRAAAFDQDLILAMLCCQKLEDREKYIRLAEEVRTHFEFHDLLFEYGQDAIAVVLPNTDLEQGIAEFGDFQKHLFSREIPCDFDVAIGISSRNGRLIRSDRIILEAHAAMKKATKNRETRIIGFKPDPGKYRNYLARQSAQA